MKNPKMKLWLMTLVSSVIIAFAIFLSAGTLDYWQGWAYLVAMVVTSIPLAAYFAKNPILLENRTKFGPGAEQRTVQKIVVFCSTIPLVALFILPPLDYRFGWSQVPSWLSLAGDLLILIGMRTVYRVFKENAFGAATIQVADNQKVISSGPYAVVRNPMYSCAIIYCVGVSLALGSYWGLIAVALVMLGFVWRLLDEEKFLSKNLSGYTEYCGKVKYHLIPFVW